jgi:hypothetical protein
MIGTIEPATAARPEIGRPEGFPDVLKDAQELADYVVTWAVGEVCSETAWESFRDCRGTLRWFDMAEIRPAGGGHERVASRERRYRRMDRATCPPILVMDGEIQDGHHRHRVAITRGDAGMWGYDVVYVD